MNKRLCAAVVMAAALLSGCEKLDMSLPTEEQEQEQDTKQTTGQVQTRNVTFKIKGGFNIAPATRAAVTANGTAMTDIWVLDYMNGALVQQVHQEGTAEDFGSPTLSLALGQHDIYFVCSAGGSPVLSTEEHKISFGILRDTFWQHISKTVRSNAAASQTVTLDRVATKLQIQLEDAIAEGTATISCTPTKWYYGVDYLTGNGTDMKSGEATPINIPASYIGKTNRKLYWFGIAQDEEFTTDATITAKDSEGNILAEETITDAPMQKNRTTEYTGTLFLGDNALAIGVNDTWEDSWTGTW